MNGVVAYLTETQDGRTTLTFDDVSSDEGSPTCWRHEILYTLNSYDSDALEHLSLTKEQFAEIGENLIMRLLARNGKLT